MRLTQLLALGLALLASSLATAATKPNIVFILADDLGYGDVRAFNPEGKIATPHLDRLAAQGMRFTDAHSGSAVCSPTRYGVLTGRYAWRSRLKQHVLGGLSPRLIEPDRVTVASFLKQNGYHTGCVGKWHLGMDWARIPGKAISELAIETPDQVHNVDYAQPIANGPTSVGFDWYYGISASLDMVPYAFIENDHVTSNPTAERRFPLMLGRPTGTTRLGPAAPGFDAVDVLPVLTSKAIAYIDQRAAAAQAGTPFFLYLPFASPHTPIIPRPDWRGRSGLNMYADFVMQTDAAIGQVLDALDRKGLTENTLVIATSDNGCSPQADFPALLAAGHDPSARMRGTKADIYEGGHRVPFIARWPGHIASGSTSDQTIWLGDFLATCANILGQPLGDTAAEDSVSVLPALLGTARAPIHEAVVHHSINGSFAIRQGDWKLALCPGSGGWSAPRPGRDDTSSMPPIQLFNLRDDPAETTNLQDKHPEIVERLTKLLESYVAEGRSTPGPARPNTTPVEIWKSAGPR